MTTASYVGILNRAVEVLDERGWCQGDYSNVDDAVCLLGALNIAEYGNADPPRDDELTDDWREAIWAVERHLHIGYTNPAYPGEALGRWNDADGRTVDEVRAAFLAAAERAS